MRTTTAILTFILLTNFSSQVFACSCIGQTTVQEEVKHADAVLVGTIVSKGVIYFTDSTVFKMFPNDTTMQKLSQIPIARYELLVQDIYKGKISSDTVIIYTGIGGGDCGFRFKVGERYIVYGENKSYLDQMGDNSEFPKGKNIFWTYLCLQTTSFYQDEITEIEKFAIKKKRKPNVK